MLVKDLINGKASAQCKPTAVSAGKQEHQQISGFGQRSLAASSMPEFPRRNASPQPNAPWLNSTSPGVTLQKHNYVNPVTLPCCVSLLCCYVYVLVLLITQYNKC